MSAIVALVVTSACGVTAVPQRSLEPLEPLEPREPPGLEAAEGASDTSGGGSAMAMASGSTESDDVASMPPDVSAALVAASAELVEHCVELVRVGAFLGEAEFVEWWDDVDRDEATLRDTCRELAATDPWRLERISDEWSQLQAVLLAPHDDDDETAGTAETADGDDADVSAP